MALGFLFNQLWNYLNWEMERNKGTNFYHSLELRSTSPRHSEKLHNTKLYDSVPTNIFTQ